MNRCCGTCRWWERNADRWEKEKKEYPDWIYPEGIDPNVGWCEIPPERMPDSVLDMDIMAPDRGTKCPTWEPKGGEAQAAASVIRQADLEAPQPASTATTSSSTDDDIWLYEDLSLPDGSPEQAANYEQQRMALAAQIAILKTAPLYYLIVPNVQPCEGEEEGSFIVSPENSKLYHRREPMDEEDAQMAISCLLYICESLRDEFGIEGEPRT